jgi:hypothetical protein
MPGTPKHPWEKEGTGREQDAERGHPARSRALTGAAVRVRGQEFTRLASRYDAAVTAANSACRALHRQAARTGSAAA